MTQLDFFAGTETHKILSPEILDYRPAVFDKAECEFLLDKFIREMPWQQRTVQMYGKEVITPRLTAWLADPEIDYPLTGYHARPFS